MARRKKGGQKLQDLGKRKPKSKIKVDLTPHYRPKQPPRGKPTGGPPISSPTRPPAETITGPGPFAPPDKEGRLRPRKPKSVRASQSQKSQAPSVLKQGYPTRIRRSK